MTNYIDISDIETYLGVTFDATTSPTLTQMTEYLNKAESDFENDVGVFKSQTNTDVLVDGHYFGIILDKLPVVSITSVKERSGTLFNPTYTAISSGDIYIKNADIGTIYLANPVVGEQQYKVTYVSGYAKASMPETIKTLVMMYALRHAFQFTFFDTNGEIGGKTEIIDVDVYREITNGGSPYAGLKAIDDVIAMQKSKFMRGIKTFVK